MWFPFLRLRVVGHSMEPVFKEGNRLVINRLAYLFKSPKKSDIIALKHPKENKILLKKVEGVSVKEYFVGGFNKNDSEDSRQFGVVSRSSIIGKVLTKY